MADALSGKSSSAAATAFANQCAETPFTSRDDELVVSFFTEVASTVPAAVRLKASRNLMRIDPFHLGLNDVLRQSALEMKTPDASDLEKRTTSLERIHPIAARLQRTASPENQLTASDAAMHLPEADRRLLAGLILTKPHLFLASAVQDALITAITIGVTDRAEAMTRAFLLDLESEKVFRTLRTEVPSPDGALRADLESIAESLPPVFDNEPNASELRFARKSVLRLLTAWLAS